jgi:urease accessory protein
MINAALLVLADGRFPSGGHAHSAGAEPAVGVGDVVDLASLRDFVLARLDTTGTVDAAFTAAVCGRCRQPGAVAWGELEAEHVARTASARLRAASRTLGRQLLRAGRRAFPSARYDEAVAVLGPSIPQPIVMGAVAAAAGCTPSEAAAVELHHLVGSMTSAGVRLLGLDPFDVAAFAAELAPTIQARAAHAAAFVDAAPADLPGDVALLNDVLAEHHGTWEVRLFAS